MFVFCGVEENEVEVFWFFGNDVRGVAEDLGDVVGEICFCEVFGCEVEAKFFVGFDGVEVEGGGAGFGGDGCRPGGVASI